MVLSPAEAWAFLPVGYAATVAVELPVLLLGLSRPHSLRTRIAAGLALTACTYPIVLLVLPELVWRPHGRAAYLAVAETFAPLAECLLFAVVFQAGRTLGPRERWRDLAAVVAANLLSFLVGVLLF